MASEMQFAGLTASLRAPRIAVVIPVEAWEFHARNAIKFFSRTWGGAGGVLVPSSNGQVSTAVERLLRRFDPDYITTLHLSVGDMESLSPGKYPIEVDGKLVKGQRRQKFIQRIEQHGPQMIGTVVDREIVDSVSSILCCFRDVDDGPRIIAVSHFEQLPKPLSGVELNPADQVLLETGEPLVDLAMALKSGLPTAPQYRRTSEESPLTTREVASVLTSDDSYQIGSPFESTKAGLTWITYGMPRSQAPVIVLGTSVDDMALAMLWDRITGTGVWLPFDGRHTRWHSALAEAVDLRRRVAGRTFIITSVSWSEDRCNQLMDQLWKARTLPDNQKPWNFVAATDLTSESRIDLRLNDRWDQRFATPINARENGASEMATTFPLIASEEFPVGPRDWIVDVEWAEHPIHSHPAVRSADLIASTQEKYETFVRVSGNSVSFESGRFDFVVSGASRFGQLAQPKLRWPGLLNTLRIVSASNGYNAQPSHAGRVGRIASELWQGRESLADDLAGPLRPVLDVLLSGQKKNGPIDTGPDVTDENRRLMFSGTCLVPFGAFERIATTTGIEVRPWLDSRIENGAIRVGLALECGVCPWRDFYRLDEVGSHFACKRCGSHIALAQDRWRKPASGPRWYYSLHPTVTEFLEGNGDVPILAVRQFHLDRRALDAEFEIELVKEGETLPSMEVDFAFMSRDGLVLGEAKSINKLDGANKRERVRDAAKLVDAAHILGAREICFATTKTWGTNALEAIEIAVRDSNSRVTVSVLEKLGTPQPGSRRVLHNPGGP